MESPSQYGIQQPQSKSGTIGRARNSKDHHSSFRPNWSCRAVVDVLVIAPAVPETPVGVKTIRFGVLKLARLSRLKNSVRNWNRRRSVMVVSFIIEKSQVPRPGPGIMLRPALPQKPELLGGARKAAGLNHCEALPRTSGPWKLGLRKGRTGLRVSPLLDGL